MLKRSVDAVRVRRRYEWRVVILDYKIMAVGPAVGRTPIGAKVIDLGHDADAGLFDAHDIIAGALGPRRCCSRFAIPTRLARSSGFVPPANAYGGFTTSVICGRRSSTTLPERAINEAGRRPRIWGRYSIGMTRALLRKRI